MRLRFFLVLVLSASGYWAGWKGLAVLAGLTLVGCHLSCRWAVQEALAATARGDYGIARVWLEQLLLKRWLPLYDRQGRVARALEECNQRPGQADRVLREITIQ